MKKSLSLSLLALLATFTAAMAQEPVETRAYYSTNPDECVGKQATITIDGEMTDWDESMIIATGGANDQCNAFKGAHENCVLDLYALYAAWDETNLYVAWQMVNTADIWAREGDGPLSDGGRVLDVPLALCLSIDPSTPTLTGLNKWGKGLWGDRASMGFEFGVHVDHLLLMSGKPGLGEPSMFIDADGKGNSDYDAAHCFNFKTNGIDYKMKEGFLPSHLWRMKLASPTVEDVYDESNYTNLLGADYSGKAHNTAYDSFYEIKIPLSLLGITKEWLETYGIGCRIIATRGESGIDCLPHDPSMLDNVLGSYGSDPSTSHEKDDIDLITYRNADIGAIRDIESIPPVDPVDPVDPDEPDEPEDPNPSDGNWNVYFQDNGSPAWTAVMTWIWDAGNGDKNYTGGSWPGAAMSRTTINGADTWKYSFSTTDNISKPMVIFNNGSGEQTDDLVLENDGIYNRSGKIGSVTGIEAASVGNSSINISGLKVRARGIVTIYNLQGSLVAKGLGAASAPSAGTYIIVAQGKAVKATMR